MYFIMLLMTKLKNEIKSQLPNAKFFLKNININGVKRGCSGFIKYDDVIVYVNTETTIILGLMYRYAENLKDYKGCTNMWAPEKDNKYINAITDALKNKIAYRNEIYYTKG